MLQLLPLLAGSAGDAQAGAWPLTLGAATGGLPPPPGSDAGGGGAPAPVVLDVTAFGAKGDNATDCTAAIEAALRQARGTPGATVRLPSPGIYLCGPLLLNGSRHLTLLIEEGATLASAGIDLARRGRWPIVPDLPSYGSGGRVYAPILWLLGAHDVVVRGGGTLDGRAEGGWWQTAVRPPPFPNATCPDPACVGCWGSCPSRPRLFLAENCAPARQPAAHPRACC